jgi:hypothetical protein
MLHVLSKLSVSNPFPPCNELPGTRQPTDFRAGIETSQRKNAEVAQSSVQRNDRAIWTKYKNYPPAKCAGFLTFSSDTLFPNKNLGTAAIADVARVAASRRAPLTRFSTPSKFQPRCGKSRLFELSGNL